MWIESILGCLFLVRFSAPYFECVMLYSCWKYKLAMYAQIHRNILSSLVLCWFSSSGLFWGHTYVFYNWAIITSDAILRFRFGFGFWLCILSKANCISSNHYLLPWSYSIHGGKKKQVIYINKVLNKGARSEKESERTQMNVSNMLWQQKMRNSENNCLTLIHYRGIV